jgi:hypothetical protein
MMHPIAAVYKNYFLQLENYQKIQMKQSNISISELQSTCIWTSRIQIGLSNPYAIYLHDRPTPYIYTRSKYVQFLYQNESWK